MPGKSQIAVRPATERRWKAAEVARAGGVSVQQIRNYLDLGMLPAVERAPSGYRIFTERHAAAVTVLRRMIEGHGWACARAVLVCVHTGDLDLALAHLDRSHAELDRERAEIAAVLSAFETIATARPSTPVPAARPLRIGEVARIVAVRTSALRVWEERGLLHPERQAGTGYRLYDETNVRAARVIALLRRGNYALSIVEAVMAELRTTGSPTRVRAELRRREQDLRVRSMRRLGASALLYQYLQRLDLAP
jgi:DNA-binding transcriptional MerR regulator